MVAQLSFDTTPEPDAANNAPAGWISCVRCGGLYRPEHLGSDGICSPCWETMPPAPVADWDNDDACSQCGAESGISGAHDHTGAWHHVPAILTRYGWTFPDMPAYDNVFAEPIVKTRLVDGRCAYCRAKGGGA